MHYSEIDKDHNRISKLKKYISNYNWNGINFPTNKIDWNKFEKKNNSIALNIFMHMKKLKN